MPRPKPSVRDEVLDLITWSADARCQRYNPAIFDLDRLNQHTEMSSANQRAVEICLGCPVMMQCLEHAIKYGCTGAIYGGMTDDQRAEWAARELVAA